MAKTKDLFAQLGYISITESGANTLTFNGLSVFSNILEPKGLIIHRVEYAVPVSAIALMTAAEDEIAMGLAGDDGLATVALDDAGIYDYKALDRNDFGTAASGVLHVSPLVTDFTKLPGGGILVPADRIYVYVQGAGLASAVTMSARFWFTIKDLSAQEYIELAQALRVLT